MGEVTVQALCGVDFDLYSREWVVLLGPSGSGKSTLLNILGGLDVPTSGDVVYQDHNLTSANDAQLTEYRRTHVGFVFQFYNLIPSLTARENVTLVTDIVEHPMTAEQAPDGGTLLTGDAAMGRTAVQTENGVEYLIRPPVMMNVNDAQLRAQWLGFHRPLTSVLPYHGTGYLDHASDLPTIMAPLTRMDPTMGLTG